MLNFLILLYYEHLKNFYNLETCYLSSINDIVDLLLSLNFND